MVEKNKSFQVGAHIVMVFLSLCCILPFVLLIASSFTDENELIRSGYSFIPAKFSLDAYAYMFKSSNKIFNAYGITILVTVIGTVAGLAMTVLMAYPLSRRDLPGRNGLAFYVFFTMLFSGGLVPTYMMYTRYIKVSSTIWALIVPSLLVNAFYVIMMRTYFNTNIPDAVIEAARIDGANEARIQWSIVLPLITPTLFYIAVTTCIEALQAFAQINILTKGGPGQATTTITYNIYTTAFNAGSANFGIASALGIVLFLFVFVLTLLQFRFLEGKVNY